MICISLRYSRISEREILAMSTPSKMISPEVGSNRRKIVRPAVVLPEPDSPTRPTTSPGFNIQTNVLNRLDVGDDA